MVAFRICWKIRVMSYFYFVRSGFVGRSFGVGCRVVVFEVGGAFGF